MLAAEMFNTDIATLYHTVQHFGRFGNTACNITAAICSKQLYISGDTVP